jgi:hypothetical protein
MWKKLCIGEKITSVVGNGEEIQMCQGYTYVGTKIDQSYNQNI